MRTLKIFASLGMTLACVLLTARCGEPTINDINNDGKDDGTPTTTVIAPSYVVGTVTGLVLAAETGVPISGDVKIMISAGTYAQEVNADASGRFTFTEVPAGMGVSLTIEAAEYTTAQVHTMLQAEVGNFPTSSAHVFVGPVELLPTSGMLRVRVVGPDGQPEVGKPVHLATDFGFVVDGLIMGHEHQTATTADGGLAEFTGLPDPVLLAGRMPDRRFVLTVPAATDGSRSGATTVVTVAQAAVQGAPTMLVLGYATGELPVEVVASNLTDLVGAAPSPRHTPSVIEREGTLYLAFNQPIDDDSLLLRMVGEEGGSPIDVLAAQTLSADGIFLQLALADVTLQAGQEYNLFIEARPALSGRGGAYRGAVTFFTRAVDNVQITSFFHEEVNGNRLIDAGDYIWFRMNTPLGARRNDGQPAAESEMLPIYVQAVGEDVNGSGDPAGPDHPFEYNYQGELLPPKARVVEVLPPGGLYTRSGYSTALRVTIPVGAQLTPNDNVTFRLEFNNPVGAAATETYRVASPQGVLPAPPNKPGQLVFDPNAQVDGG